MRINDVARWLRERGGYCTVAEVAANFGMRRNTARAWLNVLHGEGKVRKSSLRGDESFAAGVNNNGKERKFRQVKVEMKP